MPDTSFFIISIFHEVLLILSLQHFLIPSLHLHCYLLTNLPMSTLVSSVLSTLKPEFYFYFFLIMSCSHLKAVYGFLLFLGFFLSKFISQLVRSCKICFSLLLYSSYCPISSQFLKYSTSCFRQPQGLCTCFSSPGPLFALLFTQS